VRHYSARLWARLRNRGDAAAAEEDAFLGRLKQRKAQADENIERGKGARRFETTGAPPPASAPAGADAAEATRAPAKPPTAPPTTTRPPAEEDYFSKLRRAKKRAPHEQKRDEDTDEPRPGD
jgi:pyruvate/2-oxoglutarate dehydrogenase complex dihydrolipoamide acyltransferase (E2) component